MFLLHHHSRTPWDHACAHSRSCRTEPHHSHCRGCCPVSCCRHLDQHCIHSIIGAAMLTALEARLMPLVSTSNLLLSSKHCLLTHRAATGHLTVFDHHGCCWGDLCRDCLAVRLPRVVYTLHWLADSQHNTASSRKIMSRRYS